jgi:predicted nucleic acid-binding protein
VRNYTIEMRFVDSNILIYAIASGKEEREKSERALGVLEEADLATSVQVLQEFYVQATRATRKYRISHNDAVAFIQTICGFPRCRNSPWVCFNPRWQASSAIRFLTGTRRS